MTFACCWYLSQSLLSRILADFGGCHQIVGPKQIAPIESWNAKQLYQTIKKSCFTADPFDRASFSTILSVFEKELTNEELGHFKKISDSYQCTKADYYLGYGNKK